MSFSIIIPCYNSEKTLSRTLDSLFVQQDYITNIVLIDDGSQDDTARMGKRYQELYPGVIEYHHQPNQGPARARNHGIEHIKGDYTLFLDSDDTLTPNALQYFCETFDKFPGDDILIAGYCSVHDDKEQERTPSDLKTSARLLRGIWFNEIRLCGGATAMRSHLLKKARYPETITHGEDIVFFSHLIAQYPTRTLSFIALNVHHHTDSLRHHTASILKEGEAIIPLLFNPEIFNRELMDYKNHYHAQHLINLAKVSNKENQQARARVYLRKAYRLYPESFLDFRTLKILTKSFVHS